MINTQRDFEIFYFPLLGILIILFLVVYYMYNKMKNK